MYCNKRPLLVIFTLLALCMLGRTAPGERLLQYNTNPDRTNTVQTLCEAYDNGNDRASLVNEDDVAQADGYKETLTSMFGIEPHVIGEDVISNFAGAAATLTAQIGAFVQLIGAFVIGLLLVLTMWTCLLCCCCCPSCCPSKCCQKNETEPYTKCELYWPTIVLILALILTLVGGAMGLSRASGFQDSTASTLCSTAILFDDMINGNVTDEGNFFIGIRTLANQLSVLANQIGDIKTQLDNVGTGGGTDTTAAYNAATTAMNSIDIIPDGTAGGSVSNFNYLSPFDDAAPGDTVQSTMPAILGSSTDEGTLVHLAHYEIELTSDAIDGIQQAADTFGGSIGTFSGAVGDVSNTVGDFASLFEDIDSSYGGIADTVDPIMQAITSVTTAICACMIVFSILGLVGAFIMTFCSKPACRHLIYVSCVFLFLFAIIGFLLSTIFSLIVPSLFFTCGFLDYALESPANFQSLFGSLLGDNVDYVSVCLKSGSGDFISVIGGDTTETLDSLSETITDMDSFDVNEAVDQIGTLWDTLEQTMDQFYKGHTFDFSSNSDVTILEDLADPGNYGGCTDNNFQTDSWIPTLMSGAQVSCDSGASSGQGNLANCVDANTADDNPSVTACTGCMDAQVVLGLFESGSGTATELKERYAGGGACNTWADEMQNVWDNYYGVKETNYVTSNINSRIATADSDVDSYKTALQNMGTTFQTVLSNLQGIASSIVDPQYGLIAGFNCQIFGADMDLIINTMCVRMFNTFYFLRLAFGIGAFGILFAMCCSVCTGVRHFKQEQRSAKLFPNGNRQGDATMGGFNEKTY